ncbi:hypothetical protein [Lysinibacillus parviboronicapiens]|uniref:hypothetical protein n=1 Tax=Lysinibacillus parviboronicapiens TaxID=436516 RepID=UPI000D36B8DA|nr:hypothetical protein [Lysinibacillus parviboronicapiens]
MEDSKLYSTQEIEKLKQKINSYRETLTSLKMGTSIEDFLFMKNEFDGLKTQMAHLEGLTETLDDKQNSHIRGYEDQIKLLSTQIESLNQTIDEMNQEIFTVLNRLLTIEVNEAPATLAAPTIEKNSPTTTNTSQRHPRITQTPDQSTITSKQPSYKLLQSLAGKATTMQLTLNNGIPSTGNDIQGNKPEERHFNQQYFQSINTHPSQIYNGLYRNTTVESTFHFKKATDAQEIPVSIYDPKTVLPAINNESIDNNVLNSSIVNESVNDVASEKTHEPDDHVSAQQAIEPDDHVSAQQVIEPDDHVSAQQAIEPDDHVSAQQAIEPDDHVSAQQAIEPDDHVSAQQAIEPDDHVSAQQAIEPDDHVSAQQAIEPDDYVNAQQVNASSNDAIAQQVHEPGHHKNFEKLNEPVYSDNSSATAAHDFKVFEASSGEVDEIHLPLEEVNKQPDLIAGPTVEENKENKKEKNSFFNFFRKWS